jgi:2-desacetyl-2-hydroxyethyl bacteriochlorophyllide A dehydrogenase
MEIKQVVVTGQNEAELQSLQFDHEQLDPNEVLIKTEYSFISAGTELANYTGREPQVFQPGSWCAYPWKSGYANVGIVQAVGKEVTRAKTGQRVFTFGPHASLIKMSESRLIVEVPEEIDPAIAAASRMAGVATTAVILSDIPKNGWVVVYGLGMVGNLAAQAFQILGCRVIGVDPVESRRQLAERCGISITIGGTQDEVQQAVHKLTNGRMAEVAVDAVGHSGVVLQAIKTTATHGQLVLLGSPRVPVEANVTELLSEIHLRFITLRGALEWCLPTYSELPNTESLYSKQEMIFDWLKTGKLKVEPQISHRLRPEQIKEAYDGLLNQPEQFTGVVIEW